MNQNMDDKKTIRAWTFYDWANSAYSLIITSAIFPAYYTAIVPENVDIAGMHFNRSALASYSISFSYLLIALLSPFLSSIADFKGNKKANQFKEELEAKGYQIELVNNSHNNFIKVVVNYTAVDELTALGEIRNSIEKEAWLLN